MNCSTFKNGRAVAITAYKEMAEYQRLNGDVEMPWANIIKNKENDDEVTARVLFCISTLY